MSKVSITVPITVNRPGPNYETTTDRVGDIECLTGNRDVIVVPPGALRN